MIKGLCVEQGGNGAKFIFEGSTPLVGRTYFLEDLSHGSANQNKLFHALLTVFWEYMFSTNTFEILDGEVGYNLSSPDIKNLKNVLKQRYGKGFDHINYVNDESKMISVTDWEDIPKYALDDFLSGNSERIKGILVSWSDYTMPQRHKLITKTFYLMDLFGVDSGKYSDIQKGLEDIEADRLEQNRIERERKKNEQ